MGDKMTEDEKEIKRIIREFDDFTFGDLTTLTAIIERLKNENTNLEINLTAARDRLLQFHKALEKCKEQRDEAVDNITKDKYDYVYFQDSIESMNKELQQIFGGE